MLPSTSIDQFKLGEVLFDVLLNLFPVDLELLFLLDLGRIVYNNWVREVLLRQDEVSLIVESILRLVHLLSVLVGCLLVGLGVAFAHLFLWR